MKKVIVIGLDGLEPKIAEKMMRQGQLPNLSGLSQQGGYARIRTTTPAQTPVAWSTFATGTNPGGHGIYDFLTRDPNTYLPMLGLSKYEQKNMFSMPRAVNLRRGKPVWQVLSEAGVPSTVIRCPCTYPPENIKGKMLAGVGVPDLRGGLGTSAFYSSSPVLKAEYNEKIFRVDPKSGVFNIPLVGPRNPKTRQDVTVDATLRVDSAGKKILLQSDGALHELEILEGKWSDWLKVRFKIGMLQTVSGLVRFYLQSISPEFNLYASPINFDPQAPLFPISYPGEFAAELENRLGSFYTAGMAEDHDGLINERFDEYAFLEQCAIVLRERRRMLLSELDRFEEGFFFCLLDTPDRLQHIFWRYLEPAHPANQTGMAAGLENTIEEHYQALDRIVGKVMERADEDTMLIVLSDHGMNSFQRGLNLNTWLYENGFLTLKKGSKPGEENNDFFRHVDWNTTRAYSLGLGCIYLNVGGREAQGILSQGELAAVKEGIVRKLTGLLDAERGMVAVRSVVTREQIYSGPFAEEAPDLIVNFSEGYRVSWGTPMGGVPQGLFEDNTKKWGGDHVIDPALAPGVLFVNRPFHKNQPRLEDMAPTILAALGVPKFREMEGENLLV